MSYLCVLNIIKQNSFAFQLVIATPGRLIDIIDKYGNTHCYCFVFSVMNRLNTNFKININGIIYNVN